MALQTLFQLLPVVLAATRLSLPQVLPLLTPSTSPGLYAGKGTVVVLGAIPTGFDREPHYYRKELTLKMSCSYGPGRYSPEYEEKGVDYPVAYVRWTENRNMLAFQQLIASGKVDVSYLTLPYVHLGRKRQGLRHDCGEE